MFSSQNPPKLVLERFVCSRRSRDRAEVHSLTLNRVHRNPANFEAALFTLQGGKVKTKRFAAGGKWLCATQTACLGFDRHNPESPSLLKRREIPAAEIPQTPSRARTLLQNAVAICNMQESRTQFKTELRSQLVTTKQLATPPRLVIDVHYAHWQTGVGALLPLRRGMRNRNVHAIASTPVNGRTDVY
jgi:hypothetical protein